MEKKKMSFAEFYDKCDKLYCKYEPHFFLQGCEIITNFDRNEIDNGCWYCIVKIREHVYTVLAYDHTGDSEDRPFVVNADCLLLPPHKVALQTSDILQNVKILIIWKKPFTTW